MIEIQGFIEILAPNHLKYKIDYYVLLKSYCINMYDIIYQNENNDWKLSLLPILSIPKHKTYKLADQTGLVCGATSQSTAMVTSRLSVNLTTLFLGKA